MTLRIRDAGTADAAIIAEFNRLLAAESEDITLSPNTVAAGVAALLADPSLGRYWLAELDGEVVGQIMTTREWSDWRNGMLWWIQSVYVRPEARGRGVFSALYRHVERLARETPGIGGLRLYVDDRNDRARRVYEAMGMEDGGYRVMEDIFDDH
ncbi:GNAT family N-acetyltransferase [Lentisalinibacter salinarum]|uniref:GNAT family N-acetyltransferase n=1 Tax=Lentisalinibacter salinarum TaxID=2992239 RepID=UPI0038662328